MKIKYVFIALMAIGMGCNNQSEKKTTEIKVENDRYLKTIDVEEFKSVYNKNNHIIIDVRTPAEYSSGHLRKAINIDYKGNDFEQALETLDKKKVYFVYCGSGKRSQKAMDIMRDADFYYVMNIEGGMAALKEAGVELPMEQ